MSSLGAYKDQMKKSYSAYNQAMLSEQKDTIDKMVKSVKTVKKSAADWPDVLKYVQKRFPNVDITGVPIYVTAPSIMNKYGYGFANGFYSSDLDLIFVKSKVTVGCSEAKTTFAKTVNKHITGEASVELA